MAIGFSKAFDTFNHAKLLQVVSSSTIIHNTVRWLVAYLRGRSVSCRYLNVTSRRDGLPRSADWSPTWVSHIPAALQPVCVQLHTGCADDVHAAESSVKPQMAATALTAHAEAVGHWVRERDLHISAPETHITIFTSNTQQSHLQPTVELNNTPLQQERRPKLLSVNSTPTSLSPPISEQQWRKPQPDLKS